MNNNTHLDNTNILLENGYIQVSIFHEHDLYGVSRMISLTLTALIG